MVKTISRIFSAAIIGIDAFLVEVEIDSTPGLHFLNIVGLPDKTVQEAKDRITSAIKNSGFIAPNQKNQRITINLAPADVKKEGPAYDLPIALAYLLVTKQINFDTSDKIFVGELSLSGDLRPVSGVLSIAEMAKRRGFSQLLIPKGNGAEASITSGLKIIGASSLSQLVSYLSNKTEIEPVKSVDYKSLRNSINGGRPEDADDFDLLHIKGQETAKRALAVAASGGHNILMSGPPGSGKTLLAKGLSTILPDMSYEEAIEVTKIYSVAGLMRDNNIILRRPFRNPHHTTSAVAITGGGTWPKPGEISLAHRGVLFLDEMPEFPRNVLESLRQPMENGDVVISRAANSMRFPSSFMLVGAMNPCPCGNYGQDNLTCVCSAQLVNKYQKKISGPLLDRMDIQISVPRETYEKLSSIENGQNSLNLRGKVEMARCVQEERFRGLAARLNAHMGPKDIKKHCLLTREAEDLIKAVVTSNFLSARGYHKILKVARTIADMDKKQIIEPEHLAEAISYRIKSESESFR